MTPEAECILVIIGATPEGKKELLFPCGCPGKRAKLARVAELLVDLKARRLTIPPELAVGDVKADLQEIHHAETKAGARVAVDVFKEKYGVKYAPAVACLAKDEDALLAFYDFPPDHWDHLRTPNPIGSVFATVRHRIVRTKGALPQKTVKIMVFALIRAASKTWRKLKGANQLPRLIEGVKFIDGVASSDAREHRAV